MKLTSIHFVMSSIIMVATMHAAQPLMESSASASFAISERLVHERCESIVRKAKQEMYMRRGLQGATALFIAYHLLMPMVRYASSEPDVRSPHKEPLVDVALCKPVTHEDLKPLQQTLAVLSKAIKKPWFSLPFTQWFGKEWWSSMGHDAATACNYALTMMVAKQLFETIVDLVETRTILWYVNQRTTLNALFDQAHSCGNALVQNHANNRPIRYAYDQKTLQEMNEDIVDQITWVLAYMYCVRAHKVSARDDRAEQALLYQQASEHIEQLISITQETYMQLGIAIASPDAHATIGTLIEQFKSDVMRVIHNFARWEKKP